MMQKGEKPNNKLTEENIEELNGLGFEWIEKVQKSLKAVWLSYVITKRNMVIATSLRIVNRIHRWEIGVTI